MWRLPKVPGGNECMSNRRTTTASAGGHTYPGTNDNPMQSTDQSQKSSPGGNECMPFREQRPQPEGHTSQGDNWEANWQKVLIMRQWPNGRALLPTSWTPSPHKRLLDLGGPMNKLKRTLRSNPNLQHRDILDPGVSSHYPKPAWSHQKKPLERLL